MPIFESKPRQFRIETTGGQRVFYSGQRVTGDVVLDLSEEKKAKSLIVVLEGEVRTKWYTQETNFDDKDAKPRSVKHKEKREILKFVSLFIST